MCHLEAQEDDMDLSNIGKIIMDTINMLIGTLVGSLEGSIFPLLDNLVFLKPAVMQSSAEKTLIGDISSGASFLILANTLLVSVVLWYSCRILFSYYIGAEVESPSQFFVRAVVFGIVMNSSLFICTEVINLVYYITDYIRLYGNLSSLSHRYMSFMSFKNIINTALTSSGGETDFNLFSIDGIIKGFICFGALSLVLTYALRYVMLKVIVLVSPFAFLCLISKNTEAFFRSWYKTFISLLLVQVLVAVILVIPHAMKLFTNLGPSELFTKILLAGSVYALYRANNFMREFMGGIGIGSDFYAGVIGIRNMLVR